MLKIAEYLAAAFTAYILQLLFLTHSVDAIFSATTLHDLIFLPISHLSMSIFAPALIARIVISATVERQGLINPDRWYHEKLSGEYHQITSIRGTRILYSLDPYNKRATLWHLRANERERAALALCIFGLLILLLAKHLEFSRTVDRSTTNLYGLAGMAAIWLGAWVWALAERGRWESVGPTPTPTASMEDVNRQQAYGAANIADVFEIHKALGGQTTQPRLHRPIYKD